MQIKPVKIGTEFNFLTTISEPYRDGKSTKIKCECVCGKEVSVRKYSLVNNTTKSCGCYNKIAASKRLTESNKKYSIDIKHPLYQSFKGMKTRCYNPKVLHYIGPYIKVCDSWKDNFENYYNWAIDKWSNGLVLSRIDKNKDYCPENCVFKTTKEAFSGNLNTEKAKQTCLQKYGVEHHNQTELSRKRLKETCPFSNEDIKKQIKATNLKKYGFEYACKNPEVKAKIVETNLEKYGVTHPNKTEYVINKIRNTMIKTGHMYSFDDKNSGQLAKEIGISRSCMNARIRKYGYEIACSMDKRESEIETLMSLELDKLGIKYEKQVKVEDKFADFVVNDIVIEVNGLYWHSDAINKNKNYHKNKRNLYIKNNLKPLFFREDEVINKRDIVLSIIKNKLGINGNKVYARKCELIEVSAEVGKLFFESNHLMGFGSGKILGLKFKDELVCCLQFINKAEYYDISRFATKINCSVVGGFSRLLKRLTGKKIRTFIDRMYGFGDYLDSLGFKKLHEYISFRWTKNDKTYHRMQFPGNSGYNNKYYKIWDCGQALYERNFR